MEENTTYSWTPNQTVKSPKKKPDFKRAGKTLLVFFLAFVKFFLFVLKYSVTMKNKKVIAISKRRMAGFKDSYMKFIRRRITQNERY